MNISESTNFRGRLQEPSPTKVLKNDALEMRLAHYHGGIKEATNKRVETAGNVVITGSCGEESAFSFSDLPFHLPSWQPGSQVLQMHQEQTDT